MSWYYIDNAGTTLGPLEESVITSKWKSGGITEQTYVWNGTTVNDWSLINAVPFLLTKLQNSNKPAPGPPGRGGAPKGRPAAGGGRPKKKAGGVRLNLLDSIRGGKALKKVEKKELPASIGGAKGSGGGMGPKKGGGKLSLQDQLKMKLGKRGGSGPKKTGGSGPKKTGGAFSKPKSAGGGFKAKTSNSSSGGNSRFGGVKKAAASSPAAKSNFGGAKKSSAGGAKMSKFELKKAIDSCNDDWVLKAISKLLS